jgi:hypothetical protein
MKLQGNAKKRFEVGLTIGALAVLLLALPIACWTVNNISGWISATNTYDQLDNVTSEYYEGPVLDGDNEFAVASINGTTVTEETFVKDTSGDWDQVTISSTEADNILVFNLNSSVEDLLNSRISELRMKFNGSKALDITVQAVKWDTVTLTKHIMFEGEVANESQILYYNMTPLDLLNAKTVLNAEPTDSQWIQILVTAKDTTKLETADVIQFQFAYGEPSNLNVLQNIDILQTTAVIMGVIFFFLAMASTKYWNPTESLVPGGKRRA